MLFKIKNKKDKGFSLMEVIISIGIISFAFVGVMAVFASNIRAEMLSRDRITAAYLAQEGVEIIKQKRDTNWFIGTDWDNGINSGEQQALSLLEVSPLSLPSGWALVPANNDNKQIFLVSGVYVQANGAHPASWEKTKFRRVISIAKPADYQIKVTATVYFGENDNGKVQVVSYLFNNWYKE
ncbi:MAG: prepilin-type N-terminal cleavage/methylation domain-containing protein [Patescibacteria group bacterium]